MQHKEIMELIENYWQREKIKINAEELLKIDTGEIKVWAWCTGMGSDADIYVVMNDGKLIHYDHYEQNGLSENFADFSFLQESLSGRGADWERVRCRYNNNLYVRSIDKAWFEPFDSDLRTLFGGNPYACLECICRSLKNNENQ